MNKINNPSRGSITIGEKVFPIGISTIDGVTYYAIGAEASVAPGRRVTIDGRDYIVRAVVKSISKGFRRLDVDPV